MAPAVVDHIIADPSRLKLGGEVRQLTLLFCDVRNFTSISERMSAAELTQFINELLTPLSEVILKNLGTIDKYMGDAIMAMIASPIYLSIVPRFFRMTSLSGVSNSLMNWVSSAALIRSEIEVKLRTSQNNRVSCRTSPPSLSRLGSAMMWSTTAGAT